jgi:hypothetical protein
MSQGEVVLFGPEQTSANETRRGGGGARHGCVYSRNFDEQKREWLQ